MATVNTVDASSLTKQTKTAAKQNRKRKNREKTDKSLPADSTAAAGIVLPQQLADISSSTTKKQKLTNSLATIAPATSESNDKRNSKEEEIVAMIVPPAETHSSSEVAVSDMVHCSYISQVTAMTVPSPEVSQQKQKLNLTLKAKTSAGKVSKMAASNTVEKNGGIDPLRSAGIDSDSSWSSDDDEEEEEEGEGWELKERGKPAKKEKPVAETVSTSVTTSRKVTTQKKQPSKAQPAGKQLSKAKQAGDPVRSLRMAGEGGSKAAGITSSSKRLKGKKFSKSDPPAPRVSTDSSIHDRTAATSLTAPELPARTARKAVGVKKYSKSIQESAKLQSATKPQHTPPPASSTDGTVSDSSEEEEKEEEEEEQEEEEEVEEEIREEVKGPEEPNQEVLSQDLFLGQGK